MKIALILLSIIYTVRLPNCTAAEADLSNSRVFVLETNDVGSILGAGTSLVVFGPPYGTNPPANIHKMVETNGLQCQLNILYHPPICYVYIYNRATNNMACLRMPATNLCRIVLLDEHGHQVKKSALGMQYGLPLSQAQIDWRRHHWTDSHQSIFLKLFPNGLPECADTPTEICSFKVKDAFEIKEAGEYELHLQLRLVQAGTDSTGKFHYPATWLPEVKTKIQIQPEDIQTNSPAG